MTRLRRIAAFLKHLAGDTRGQDMIEYALLALFFGIVGVAAWDAIETSLASAYTNFDAGEQSLWEPPAPGAGS